MGDSIAVPFDTPSSAELSWDTIEAELEEISAREAELDAVVTELEAKWAMQRAAENAAKKRRPEKRLTKASKLKSQMLNRFVDAGLPTLSSTAAAVWVFLLRHSDREGYVDHISQPMIQAGTTKGEHAVRTALKALTPRFLEVVEAVPGTIPTYRLTLPD